MTGQGVLAHTAVGRALLEVYFDLPFWTTTNLIFVAALLPTLALLARGGAVLAAVATLPPLFVLAGMTSAASRTVDASRPRWRDLLKGSSHGVVSSWLVLILSTAVCQVAPPPVLLGILVVLVGTALMPLVFAIALSSWSSRERASWRHIAVLTVRFPTIALGLLALAWILGLITVSLKGAPLLVLPAVWANVAAHAAQRLSRSVEGNCVE